jgi:hypothetical protein
VNLAFLQKMADDLQAVELTNSVASVRERTVPTERPPLVREVSANFLRIEECRVVSAADPLPP